MGAVLGVIPAAMIPVMIGVGVAGPLVGGVAVAAVIVGVIAATGASIVFRPPEGQNPTLVDIQAIQQAERARRQAESAYELAEEARLKAVQDLEEARMCQEKAKEVVARAERAIEWMQSEKLYMLDATWSAVERSEAAAGVAQEAAKLARETETREEREGSQRMREEAEKAGRPTAGIREEAERAQKAADEQLRQAEAGRALAEDLARTANEEMQKAIGAREEAERCLKEGMQPVVTPTAEELTAAKEHVQYSDGLFHFAVAGMSGSGKSSLVNAFRGLRSKDVGAAAVGVTETTLQRARYPDADKPFVWYDIPGAGTLKCPDWQYFNEQGLYVFDCIIVVMDNRFTMTDVSILTNARRFNIPTYIVRSKADQHIGNLMKEKGYDSDADDKEDVKRVLYKTARDEFVEMTRKSVKTNLEDANLPDQRVYIVSSTAMLSIVQSKMPKKMIDEVALVGDVLSQAYKRRGGPSGALIEEADSV